MTESEIVKALECCIDEDNKLVTCDDCVFMECKMGKERECMYYMLKSVLDLINRKNAKIESFTDIGKMYSEIRAEAIKEFMQRVRKYLLFTKCVNDEDINEIWRYLDQIAKEMGVE